MKEVYDWMNVNDISIVKMGIENIILLFFYGKMIWICILVILKIIKYINVFEL